MIPVAWNFLYRLVPLFDPKKNDNLTMGVSGLEFLDLYSEFPKFGRKLRLAKLVTGIRSGFGVPLRTPMGWADRATYAMVGALALLLAGGRMLEPWMLPDDPTFIEIIPSQNGRPAFSRQMDRFARLHSFRAQTNTLQQHRLSRLRQQVGGVV